MQIFDKHKEQNRAHQLNVTQTDFNRTRLGIQRQSIIKTDEQTERSEHKDRRKMHEQARTQTHRTEHKRRLFPTV